MTTAIATVEETYGIRESRFTGKRNCDGQQYDGY